MPTFLGAIDQGTSSTRFIVFDGIRCILRSLVAPNAWLSMTRLASSGSSTRGPRGPSAGSDAGYRASYCPVGMLLQPPAPGPYHFVSQPVGFASGPIHQHGLHFLDLPRLHREELADDAVVLRDRGGVLHAVDLAEAQDDQHDAALLVHHRVAAIPQVPAEETAAVEAVLGRGVDAIADGAREVRAVLEASGVGQQVGPVVVRRAIGLEGAEVAVPDGDQLVVGIALGGRDGQLQERGRLLVQLLRPPPVGSPASPLLQRRISISVMAPLATFRRTISMVSEPSALVMTTCVPVSPRRSFTASKRQRTFWRWPRTPRPAATVCR